MAGRPSLFLSFALLAGAAGAAELGEARVASYIGQPLAAEIELIMLDAPAAQVEARLAHPEVYRGANIGMPPVLSTLAMSVTRRDGRQFLRVTSRSPVESSHLHVYLELGDGGQRNVRLVTLWLAPDPNPVAPAPRPAPVLAPTPEPVSAPVQVPVPVPAPAPVALVRQAPVAVEATQATVPHVAPAARPKPPAVPKPVPVPALPELPRAAPAVAAASCAPAPAAGDPGLCAALDDKSLELRQQIGMLEDRVKVLQATIGGHPAAASRDQPHPVRKKPLHASQNKPQEAPTSGTPWAWIGAGVACLLALVASLLLWLRRRGTGWTFKQPGLPQLPLVASLRQRFKRDKPAAAVEPGV